MNMEDDDRCKNGNESDAERECPAGEQLLGRCYEICIGGRLDSTWSDWFEGFEIHTCGENSTILCGRVADQAALIGILNKLGRLNLPLVSVNEIEQDKRFPDSRQEGGA